VSSWEDTVKTISTRERRAMKLRSETTSMNTGNNQLVQKSIEENDQTEQVEAILNSDNFIKSS
jgi:hypothetical protein